MCAALARGGRPQPPLLAEPDLAPPAERLVDDDQGPVVLGLGRSALRQARPRVRVQAYAHETLVSICLRRVRRVESTAYGVSDSASGSWPGNVPSCVSPSRSNLTKSARPFIHHQAFAGRG